MYKVHISEDVNFALGLNLSAPSLVLIFYRLEVQQVRSLQRYWLLTV